MLYLLLFEKRKRRKKYKERKGQGSFSQGRHAVLAVPHWDFPDC
jgi:hypothetical protein